MCGGRLFGPRADNQGGCHDRALETTVHRAHEPSLQRCGEDGKNHRELGQSRKRVEQRTCCGEARFGADIEGTNGQEDHAVDSHYGIAPDGDMASFRELSNTARLCDLCGRRHGGPGLILH